MKRLMLFLCALAVTHFFVEGYLRDLFLGEVSSASIVLPMIHISAPDFIFYGVAGAIAPVVLVGVDLRFSNALIVSAIFVFGLQLITTLVFGSIIAHDWRGYFVGLAPLVIAPCSFVLAAALSRMVLATSSRNSP